MRFGMPAKGTTAIETEEKFECNNKWYPIKYRPFNELSLGYDDDEDFMLKYFRRVGEAGYCVSAGNNSEIDGIHKTETEIDSG